MLIFDYNMSKLIAVFKENKNKKFKKSSAFISSHKPSVKDIGKSYITTLSLDLH